MGCFWFNPEGFLALDGCNRDYFKKFGVDLTANSHAEYVALLEKVREVRQMPYADISLAAWNGRKASPEPPTNDGAAGRSGIRYWTFTPGPQGSEWERFLQEGIMAIDECLGDLKSVSSIKEIQEALQRNTGAESSVKNRTRACYDFSRIMQPGDVVFAKKGYSEVLGYGIVNSDYRHDPSRKDHTHIREVEWHEKGGQLDDIATEMDRGMFAVKTLTDITSYPEFVKKLSLLTGYAQGEAFPLSTQSHYWLNANPKIWSFESVALGKECTYTSTNQQGNKRNRYKCFQEARPGDILVGYVTTPKRAITAICEVTKSLHASEEGEAIAFKKIRNLTTPVAYEELITVPEIAESEPLKSAQGSLFNLTQSEYAQILKIVDEKNPVDTEGPYPTETPLPYTVDMATDCLFMDRKDFEGILEALVEKHNIIVSVR